MYANKTILQIGAHVGNTWNDSIFPHVDTTTKLFLVEPIPYLFTILQDNYRKKLNDIRNITFINKAVSNQVGSLTLTIPLPENDFSALPAHASQLASVHPLHALIHVPNLKVGKVSVEATTIDAILDEYGIQQLDLLNVDTEGHDYAILIEYSFKVKPKQVIFEHVHMDGPFTTGQNYATLCARLNALGYVKRYQKSEDTCFDLVESA